MPTISINESMFFVGLTKAATLFTNAMFVRTRGNEYPSTKEHGSDIVYSIEESTKISEPMSSGKRAWIDISISLKKAPYAWAYEFGHAQPYQITPKPGTMTPLLFSSERWPGYKPPPPAPDVFMFMEVTHKKIEAKPYLKPTMDAKRKEIVQLIGREFIDTYRRSVARVTVIT